SSHPTTSSILLPSIPTAPFPTVTQPDRTPIIQYSRRARIAQSHALPTAQEEEIGRLKKRVQVLKDREAVATKQSGEDAPIKGRSPNEGEAAVERISNDSEEIARVLTSIDAATVLARETDVPTGSGFIPTAGPLAIVISTGSKVGPTASPIVTRRKGKEVMVESDTPKKKKLQEQIDAQVHKFQSQQRKPMSKKQNKEYYMAVIKSNLGWRFKDFKVIKSNLGWRFKDFKGMTFEEIEVKFAEVWKQVEDFIPMSSGDIVDLIGDEDPTDEDGDTEVLVSLSEISLEGNKS
nr:hypothetical protein [Tanacetum cinerariifolium]